MHTPILQDELASLKLKFEKSETEKNRLRSENEKLELRVRKINLNTFFTISKKIFAIFALLLENLLFIIITRKFYCIFLKQQFAKLIFMAAHNLLLLRVFIQKLK